MEADNPCKQKKRTKNLILLQLFCSLAHVFFLCTFKIIGGDVLKLKLSAYITSDSATPYHQVVGKLIPLRLEKQNFILAHKRKCNLDLCNIKTLYFSNL